MSDDGRRNDHDSPRWFTTTHWSVVLNSGSDDTDEAAEALGRLCQTYWGPVNSFITRWGHTPADAEDLTQQFFARFLEKEHYRSARQERGRFRTFLLTSVKHFLLNERERATTAKRGGGRQPVSLDETASEGGLSFEPADERTAERLYEQNWALALLARARQRLAEEYADSGKEARFDQLERFLPGEEDGDMTYADAAAQLGVAEGTIKSDIHRLKRLVKRTIRSSRCMSMVPSKSSSAPAMDPSGAGGKRSAAGGTGIGLG